MEQVARYNLGRVVGEGVPPGGAPGQLLLKHSADNYDAEWGDANLTAIGAEAKRLQFADVVVSDWVEDADYGYHADILLHGVLASMTPFVVFAQNEAESGNFGPVAECGDGYVRVYGAEPPGEITIPTIICWEE